MIRYVLMLVVAPDGSEVICLKKLNRPAHLHGKWTFPGGHIEESDASPAAAATREMQEETGVFVPIGSWRLAAVIGGQAQGYELNVFVAKSSDVRKATTQTHELVKVMGTSEALKDASQFPDRYSPDFIKFLAWAVNHIALS